MKNVIIAGGSGLIGQCLAKFLYGKGYNITILSRHLPKSQTQYRYLTYKDLQNIISETNIVINLAGASIAGKRWNEKYKKELYDSRIGITMQLVEALKLAGKKPELFINTSAAGYYGSRGNEVLNENSVSGNDFLSKMCDDWEHTALEAKSSGVKTSILRIGIVLLKSGGALEKILPAFKFFVGGHLGNGRQYMPWIHINDLINIFMFLIENNLEGTYNATAPNPVTNSEFSSALGKILKRHSLFPVPVFALRIILGEFSEFLISSQRAIPKGLISKGFKFEFNDIFFSLNNLLNE